MRETRELSLGDKQPGIRRSKGHEGLGVSFRHRAVTCSLPIALADPAFVPPGNPCSKIDGV